MRGAGLRRARNGQGKEGGARAWTGDQAPAGSSGPIVPPAGCGSRVPHPNHQDDAGGGAANGADTTHSAQCLPLTWAKLPLSASSASAAGTYLVPAALHTSVHAGTAAAAACMATPCSSRTKSSKAHHSRSGRMLARRERDMERL